MWARAEFNTLRLRLIKVAARVVEATARIRVWLPTACPDGARLSYSLAASPLPDREGWGTCTPLNPSRQPLTAENQTKMRAAGSATDRRGQRRKFLHTSEFALT